RAKRHRAALAPLTACAPAWDRGAREDEYWSVHPKQENKLALTHSWGSMPLIHRFLRCPCPQGRAWTFALCELVAFAPCLTGCHDGHGGDGSQADSGTSHDASTASFRDAEQAPPSASADGGSTFHPQPASDAGPAPTATNDAAVFSDPSASITDYGAWQTAIAKLRDCKGCDSGEYPYVAGWDLRCAAGCIVAASCAELQSENCGQASAPKLESCENACPDAELFSCGDGTAVSVELVCDLHQDCTSGEDEKHCSPFSCSDGSERVGSDQRCDGAADCADGSDEKGCVLVCGTPYAMI
ncbi:MAG: hypothetical protein JWN04_409, partial [Myxococcaceae bacterium]|nr:hypothetical protein [Myxococcaceae bacterium]